jgi:nitrous oxidase accessory protein NosD
VNIMNITEKIFCGVLTSMLFLMQVPGIASALTLTKDTIWQGQIKVEEDVLVPKGITLTVKAGTIIHVVSAESTKTDPEYISPLMEITVRGTLKIEGTVKEPVEFAGVDAKTGSWAGIVIDQGTAVIRTCTIRHADTAIYVVDGEAEIYDATLKDSRYGLVAQGNTANVKIERSTITENEYGLFTFQGAHLLSKVTTIKGNRKKDSYTASPKNVFLPIAPATKLDPPVSRRYQDEVFRGDTIWQGRIEVSGMIRVPEGSRLFILPGTIVEFYKKDTTGSGIGENGLMIQGRLIAKGTSENPIVFRSAEKNKRAGDWDSINIMNSASGQNLIEHCRIEHAYRGLHFHYAHVGLYNSTLTGNYRGIQFQESLVVFKGNHLYDNKSGIQGRDSDVTLTDNFISSNMIGANFFRTNLNAHGNQIVANAKEGMRIREGVSSLQENHIDGNRFGLMVADMFYGDYSRNSITNNLEVGISLKNADNIKVIGNFVAGNGFNGLSIQESRATIKGNQISDNGEHGIGVQSFDGEIIENNFIKNRLYAIDLEGAQDVSALGNWWGGDDPAKVIFDKQADSSRGKVLSDNASTQPFRFVWPLNTIPSDVIWRGVVAIPRPVAVLLKADLTVAPKTEIEFSEGAGMLVKGRLIAKGEHDGKIKFTSDRKKGSGDWDEIQLEYATGSIISNCIFEYATWGLHSHFTNLVVSDSYFANNYGGMRFRSGPAEIRGSVFENNEIGIRAYIGNAVIRGNTIRNNETGIFVREKGGGLVINGNNFYNNKNYGIRVGDFNDEDVNARGNWWGGADLSAVIFDAEDEPGIGRVLVEPVLTGPVGTSMEIVK